MGRPDTRNPSPLRSLRVLIAPDKFKGTLTAAQAAQAIASGWSRIRPQDRLDLLPITDGGDGFGAAMAQTLDARARKIQSVDPAGRPHIGAFFWQATSQTAIIESASIMGLALLPPGKFHPFELDTFGVSKVLEAAHKLRPKTCFVGIGGSATNDGGFGLARALGWKFLDSRSEEITNWPDLSKLTTLVRPEKPLVFRNLLVAVDVQNTLLGRHGASRVYGPQKGLQPRDFPTAEAALRRLAKVAARTLNVDYSTLPGSGAAGGLGFGLAAFCGAALVPGFKLFAKHADLETQLRRADLVITGEGSIDRSTFMGKGVGELAKLCRKLLMPCYAIGGLCNVPDLAHRLLQRTSSLCSLTEPYDAKGRPTYWLKKAAEELATAVQATKP